MLCGVGFCFRMLWVDLSVSFGLVCCWFVDSWWFCLLLYVLVMCVWLRLTRCVGLLWFAGVFVISCACCVGVCDLLCL